MYFSLKSRIITAWMKANQLAMIIGKSLTKTPYKNHKNTPPQNNVNILVEMSLVDFVFHTFMSCGNSEIVVNRAAIKPRIVISSIDFPMWKEAGILPFDLTSLLLVRKTEIF